MIKDYKAFLLTFIQYSTLPLMMWRMTWFSHYTFLVVLQLVGLFIASWAIWVMQRSKLNISPTPRKGAILITNGIYKWIRHPMYTSLLLTFIPMILSNNYNALNSLTFAVFFINLILKLEYEEILLSSFFKEYKNYQSQSWKIIPYLY